MNKETWIKHMEETNGIIRPSQGGNKDTWKEYIVEHKAFNCELCADRARTRKTNRINRERNEVLKDICGTSARAAKLDMGL